MRVKTVIKCVWYYKGEHWHRCSWEIWKEKCNIKIRDKSSRNYTKIEKK